MRRLLIPATVLACLSLTACQGGDEPGVAPSGAESSAASASPAVGSPSASPALDATARDFLRRLERGIGTSGTAHMAMKVGGPAKSQAEGDLRYDEDGSELRLTTRTRLLGDRPFELVVLRDAAYLSIPGATRPGTFFEVDPADPRFEQLAGSSVSMSPAESVKGFRAGLVSVEDRGRDTVQGEPVTRYDVEVDSARALQAQGAEAVPGIPETLTYQVWLDGQDRMRRMTLTIQGIDLRIDLSDWGRPVEIEAPDESRIVEAPQGF